MTLPDAAAATSPDSAPAPWKLRYGAVFIGQSLSLLGSQLTQFVLLWWITDTTGSVGAVATAGIAALLPQALLSPLGGALADRYSRRALMILADAVSAACIVALIALFATGGIRLWQVYAVMAVRSAMQAFQSPAAAASVPMLVPRSFLPRAAGLNQTLQGITAIMAAPLGALALGLMPLGWALSIDVFTAAVAIGSLLVFRIPQPARAGAGVGSTVLQDLAEGLRYIGRHPGLRHLYALLAGVMLLVMPAFTLVPLLVKQHFGQGPAQVAAVQGFLGAGMVAGGLLMTALAPRRQVPWILGGFALCSLALAGMALTPAALAAAAPLWWGLAGLAFVAGNTPLVALIQLSVPNELQGRAFSLLSALVGLAAPVGLALASPAGEWIGIRGLFIGMGLLGAAGCLAGFGSRALRSLQAVTEAPATGRATQG